MNFFEPIQIKNIFSRNDFDRIQKLLHKSKTGSFLLHCDKFNRLSAPEISFLKEHHQEMAVLVSIQLGKPLKPSYVFLSCYDSKGICPPHKDRPPCRYSLGVCLNQNEVWDFHIEDRCIKLEKNEGIIYSGSEHLHWRDQIQPDNFCDVVLFHFVDEEYSGSLL